MNSPAPSEHSFPEHIFSEVEDEDNGIYYDEEGNVLDLSHVDWSQHEFVAITNDSGVSTVEDLLVPPAGRIVALVFFMVIFVVGVVGNGLVVYTVGRQISTRKVTYLYLLNLSASNLLYLVICLPTLSVSHTIISWPFGNVLCKLNNYVMSVSMAVSVLTITATGFDRYLAVIYPVESRMLRTTRRAVVINGSCWLVSLLIMIPRIFLYNEKKVFHEVSLVTLCYRIENLFTLQIDTVLNFVLMYLLPLTLLSLFHFRIGKRLWYITRPGTRTVQTGNTHVLVVKDRRRIAKIVCAITLVFALGWLPIHVYHLAEDFNSGLILFGQEIDRGTLVLFFSFGANSFNPILYCMFSCSFRQSFRKALRLCAMKLSRAVHVEEAVDVRVERAPQVEYRRPPPMLLPRPPTTSKVEAISFLQPPGKICANTKLTIPLIQGLSSEFCVNNLEAVKEIMPDASPLSLKKEPHIKLVNDEEITQSPKAVLLNSKTVDSVKMNLSSQLCDRTDKSHTCLSSQVSNCSCNDGQVKDHDSEVINPQCSSHNEKLSYTNQHASLDIARGRTAHTEIHPPRKGGVVSEIDIISTSTSSTIIGGGLSSHHSTSLIVPSRSVTKHVSELMSTAANFGNLLTPLNNKQTKHLPQVE